MLRLLVKCSVIYSNIDVKICWLQMKTGIQYAGRKTNFPRGVKPSRINKSYRKRNGSYVRIL